MEKSALSKIVYLSDAMVVSEPIKAGLFGANFLLGRDSISGTYGTKIQDMGATLLRYPGGGIAENDFDLTNPDSVPISRNGTYDTLSEFLEYSEVHGITPSIVIPTKKYVSDVAQGVADVTLFIQRLTSGEFGNAENAIIEIGNEYYVGQQDGNPILTAAAYGDMASAFLSAIEAAATHDLAIGVQVGKTASDNSDIINAFGIQADLEAIDILIYHDYMWTQDSIESRNLTRFAALDQWSASGVVADIFVSEWNVGSSKDGDTDSQHDYGLPQASAMIEFVSEAVKYGIDFASVWAVQQNNKTSLYEDEGNLRINFGGQIFRMLSDNLVGKQALDIPVDRLLDGQIDVWAFDSDSEAVVFLSPNDFDDVNTYLDMNIDLSGFGVDYSYVWAEKLYTTGDPNDWRSSAEVEFFAPEVIGEDGSVVNISFQKDFEVVKLVFEKSAPGENSMHIVGMNSDDMLTGGFGNDEILAYGGDDNIDSGFGDDYIEAGSGNDTVFDASGNDQILTGSGDDDVLVLTGTNDISAGDGSDYIVGGIDSDTIAGGSGDDIIQGDTGSSVFGGSDVIIGGAGDDIMMGGRGADVFVFATNEGADEIAAFNAADVMYDVTNGYSVDASGVDYRIGVDHIQLDGFSTVNSSNVLDFVSNTEQGAQFSAEGTSVTIYGIDAASFTVDDFLFL